MPWASHVVSLTMDGHKYETLKTFPLKCFSFTKWERAYRILATNQLGDRRPSHRANYLLTTLGEFSADILLQQVFLHCLPTFVQDALAWTDAMDLETLVGRADIIMAWPCPPGLSVSNATFLPWLSSWQTCSTCLPLVMQLPMPCHIL